MVGNQPAFVLTDYGVASASLTLHRDRQANCKKQHQDLEYPTGCSNVAEDNIGDLHEQQGYYQVGRRDSVNVAAP